MRLSILFLSTCALLSIGRSATAAPQKAGEVRIEKKSFTTPEGEEVTFDLGTLTVPENRSDPDSRMIGVGFARIPATVQPPKAPPIFLLPGGPGFSFLHVLLSNVPDRKLRAISEATRYRQYADLIMVDQRGFSGRGEMLMTLFPAPTFDPAHPPTPEGEIAHWKKFARKTAADFEGRDIDLRGYTVKECAQDVLDLRAALGYEKITLVGTSFGSQWSFAIMRLHPDHIERALLSGVEPLDHGYDMPSYVFAAVQRMWRAIDADERYQPYLPEGGMAEAARVVIERLERAPVTIEIPQDDGSTSTIPVVRAQDFPWSDPVQILELYHGHLERWKKPAPPRGSPMKLIGPLIDSSLGVTPERLHRLWTDPATRYLGRRNFALYLETADIWPSPDVGDDFRTPILCDVPVVFAQGDWDTSTPIENTFEIAPFFPNSRMILAHRGGHGVLGPIHRELPEVWKELDEFLRTGDMEDIPARVTLLPSRRFPSPSFPLAPGEATSDDGH